MSEKRIYGVPADLQWRTLLRSLCTNGFDQSPRGLETVELLACQSVVSMTHPVVSAPTRKLSYQFMAAEALWIMNGDCRVATIAPFAPSIAKFSDDGVRFFGAYGPKVVQQLPYVVNKLMQDPSSRQAVLTIWRENPPITRDYPCTVAVQWMIRNGVLHCVDTMRSSDIWLGWPYDIFNFSMLSLLIGLRLRECGIQVELGSICLNAGSQHLYQKNMKGALDVIAEDAYHRGPEFLIADFADEGELMRYLTSVKRTGKFPL
jgi:thymidylate synthase